MAPIVLAGASPFDPVWSIGLRVDDPEARHPRRWPGKKILGKALSAVRDAICTSEAGLANPASSQQFYAPTSHDGIDEISPASPRPMALARACPGPPSEFSTCFSEGPADNSPEVLAVTPGVDPSLALPKHGPCLVGGIITLDDTSSTTKTAVHSGANALAPFGCVALLDAGSPQTFIRRDVLDSMLLDLWGGFGESGPLQTSTSVRLSV